MLFWQYYRFSTFINTSVSDVTDCSSLYNIPNDKLLDGLVFWYTSSTVCATNELHMTTPLLASSIISSFRSLKKKIILWIHRSYFLLTDFSTFAKPTISINNLHGIISDVMNFLTESKIFDDFHCSLKENLEIWHSFLVTDKSVHGWCRFVWKAIMHVSLVCMKHLFVIKCLHVETLNMGTLLPISFVLQNQVTTI